MALTIPNTITNGTDADGSKVQENFVAIRDHVNSEQIARDGSVAATAPISGVAPTVGAHLTTKTYVDAAILASAASYGDIKMTAAATAPSGWLLCRGQAVSRSTYANLFTAIGTAYGTGDGSTTFNVPNFQSRGPIGLNVGGGVSTFWTAGLGESAGNAAESLIAHTHTNSHSHTGTTTTSGAHAHDITVRHDPVSGSLGSIGTSNAGGTLSTRSTVTDGTHSHSFVTDVTASVTGSTGGTPLGSENYQPGLSVNFVIYCGAV